MKKIFTISFLLVYTTLSVGLNIIVHTCGGESKTILVTTDVSDPCDCGNEMSVQDMCCNIELKSVKIDDDQSVSFSLIYEILSPLGEIPVFNTAPLPLEYFTAVIPCDTSPPTCSDLQISNSVFRI